MKSILDPSFRYTDSANTDLRKTFARIRKENAKVEKKVVETPPVDNHLVSIFPRRSGKAK